MDCVPQKNCAAFSRLELLVVVAVIFIVAALATLPSGLNAKQDARRLRCVNNLKEIGTAARVWENEHSPDTLAASNCWGYYAILISGGRSTFLTCPSDNRPPAADGNPLQDNRHLSYFAALGVIDTMPEAILAGDRNVGAGTIPDPEYGYSPADAAGNQVAITNDVCWSLKMHSRRNVIGAGNILLADGSGQQCTSMGLRETLRAASGISTNSTRWMFP